MLKNRFVEEFVRVEDEMIRKFQVPGEESGIGNSNDFVQLRKRSVDLVDLSGTTMHGRNVVVDSTVVDIVHNL